ncbi:MAG: tRNA 4-thiouridine(8) synthase ThiI [Anaerolineae bacterium]|nr:MAG: tRNA 4-thiouridine(8) synthase ThiI [Anaerolineae bacterium]
MTDRIVIHYAEIGLKGRNRSFFERQLQRNVGQRLAGLDVAGVERLPGRLLARLGTEADVAVAVERLRTVPGIAYFAPAYSAPKDIEAIKEAVVTKLALGPSTGLRTGPVEGLVPSIVGGPTKRSYRSFKTSTRRSDKSFPLTSPQINAVVGGHVQATTGWAVDLKNPELVIHIELLFKEAFFYFERIDGVGGLPVGVSGTVGLLLSGGIDSPVAGYYALKRGCNVVPIHFHSSPFGDWQGSEDKVRRLAAALRHYGLSPRYYVVPIGQLQQEMVVEAPAPPRVLLYRRLMVRLAERLIRRQGGLALVTGESLGQVASQTLESLASVQVVATMPVLRPLIGLDKQEIVTQAQAIGTYDISIESGDDCCQFLMPRQVVTRPTLEEIEAAEAPLDVERMVADGLAAARLEEID